MAHGYETTSIVDLTTAMGVTAPSLYSTFGDKKQLFLEAARRYAGDPTISAAKIAGTASAYDAARDMLLGAAVAFTGKLTPRGCLLASATASGSSETADVQRAIADIRREIAVQLRERIDKDVATGLLPSNTNAVAFADIIMIVVQGMSVLARDGASRARLVDVANAALRAWPR